MRSLSSRSEFAQEIRQLRERRRFEVPCSLHCTFANPGHGVFRGGEIGMGEALVDVDGSHGRMLVQAVQEVVDARRCRVAFLGTSA